MWSVSVLISSIIPLPCWSSVFLCIFLVLEDHFFLVLSTFLVLPDSYKLMRTGRGVKESQILSMSSVKPLIRLIISLSTTGVAYAFLCVNLVTSYLQDEDSNLFWSLKIFFLLLGLNV